MDLERAEQVSRRKCWVPTTVAVTAYRNPFKTLFYYYVGPVSNFTQCESARIWWDPSTVQGTPNFDGIIPGGQSFTIPESSI
ncbi:hypothetical protein F5887DRAFT_972261, partial [Amanita rubescens]